MAAPQRTLLADGKGREDRDPRGDLRLHRPRGDRPHLARGRRAGASGVSRATIYRYFPGGREELIGAVIVFETLRFFARLAEAIEQATDLEELLIDGIVFAHRSIAEHEVLQKVLETEPELVVPRLTLESAHLTELIRTFLLPRFADAALPDGVDAAEAADYVARLVLSFIVSPGRWDLSDRGQVRTLVESEMLAGLTAG